MTVSVGRVFWLTGLSGAGKSTLADQLACMLRDDKRPVIVLDGDDLRRILAGSEMTGYLREDRLALGLRYARLANCLVEQGIDVIVATISMYREVYQWNRDYLPLYTEIFVDVPLEELQRRDSGGVYSQTSPSSSEVAGIGVPVDFPETPHIRLEWQPEDTPERTFLRLHTELGRLDIVRGNLPK